MNEVLNTANTQETELDRQAKIASFDSSKDRAENSPVLPREAWKSQLAFLKAILKAKQALDKS